MRLLGALLPVLAALIMASTAAAADLATLVANLVTGGYSDRDAAHTALAASGEARAAPILQA
jgi:urea transport system permease protein